MFTNIFVEKVKGEILGSISDMQVFCVSSIRKINC